MKRLPPENGKPCQRLSSMNQQQRKEEGRLSQEAVEDMVGIPAEPRKEEGKK